ETINILEPLKEALESYRGLFEKKGLFIEFEAPEKLPLISGNRELFERLFLNLLDNSLKFTEKGGLFVKVKEEKDFLKIEFEDTGIGIKEEDIPFIFERFFVSEKGRTKEKSGFGIGLSIVKHITELQKGKIEVKSQPGRGTSFILRFPL
ncbi:MAG: HAMP domain-containing sensor histidine kinase, partial [Thermoanaerobaculia bacterium]